IYLRALQPAQCCKLARYEVARDGPADVCHQGCFGPYRAAARRRSAAGGGNSAHRVARRSHPPVRGAPCPRGLEDLGWVEDQNIVIEWRFAGGRAERLPDLAAELVRLRVDLIVVPSTPTALAAKNATKTIPLVTVGGGDPVGLGLVVSLARPGGNIT